MTSDDIGMAIYLGAMLVFVLSYMLVARHNRLAVMAKQAAVWGVLFAAVAIGYGVWQQAQTSNRPPRLVQISGNQGAIEIPRSYDGHYYVTLTMNGQPVDFVVDTGASQIVLSKADAMKIGLDPATLRFTQQAYTANGVVSTAPTWVETVQSGPFTDSGVAVSVNGGAMDVSLLGMTWLNRFDKVTIEDGKMVLSRQ